MQQPEVEHDDDGNEDLQHHEELALRGQVGLAGFVNQLGDFAHAGVDRHVAQTDENHEPENQAQRADQQATEQQIVTVDAAQKRGDAQIGKVKIGLSASLFLRQRRDGASRQSEQSKKDPQQGTGQGPCGSKWQDTTRVQSRDHLVNPPLGLRKNPCVQ